MTRATPSRAVAVVGLLLPLSGCSELVSVVGPIGWLVLLPMVFVGLFLFALRLYKRRAPGREDDDERRYPDYRGDRNGD